MPTRSVNLHVDTPTAPAIVDTPTGLFAYLQLAALHNGRLRLPSHANIVIEIGVSDRETMTETWMPSHPNDFLVSCEPILDKFAKNYAKAYASGLDKWVPLQTNTSLILPLAIGPPAGMAIFHLKGTAGCSSLKKANYNAKRNSLYCSKTRERRAVPTVPFTNLLQWIDRPVQLVKIDAQGMDLDIVRSAGARRTLLRRVVVEVVSDDCDVLYEGQPPCSKILREMAALQFEPATPVRCTPIWPRRRHNALCEMDVLFLNRAAGAPSADGYHVLHKLYLNGCNELFDPSRQSELMKRPPTGKTVFQLHPNGNTRFVSSRWAGESHHPFGTEYICNRRMFNSVAQMPPATK